MTNKNSLFTPVLLTGGIILLISFAVRSSFGLFQIPIANDLGWLRADFSLAIAIQNLAWGIGQPIFAAIGEKFGDRLAIFLGAILYAIGLLFSSYAITPGQHHLLEIMVGFGIAGTGFGVILSIVGRATPDKHRSLALGIATAAGSAGQVIGPPIAQALLNHWSWQAVFMFMALLVLLPILLLPLLKAPDHSQQVKTQLDESIINTVNRALGDRPFLLIFVGFFSCGYQLAFLTAHFPAFITEVCSAIEPGSLLSSLDINSTSSLGAWAIALVGVTNIAGTILAGWLGNYYSRKYLLALIYTLRTFVAAIFILMPITPLSVVIFSLVMGILWLATVPLTSGLLAQIYGLRYMGTLYGIVFFSHQLGSFMGVWLGGFMYDLYGNYTLVWWVGVGVGALSAIVNLLMDERPIEERNIGVHKALI